MAALARQADVIERDGPAQAVAEHLADQVGHLAARPLALQPAGDGGVFVPQAQPPAAVSLIDVRGEPCPGDTRLVDQSL